MKKIIFILLITMMSCTVLTPRYVFQKTYSNVDSSLVIKDIYNQLQKYNVDSITLDLWNTSYYSIDTNSYVQKIIIHLPERGKEYDFIYTKFIYPSKTYYEFKVRYLGK